jgi:hypothetical protein
LAYDVSFSFDARGIRPLKQTPAHSEVHFRHPVEMPPGGGKRSRCRKNPVQEDARKIFIGQRGLAER